MKNDFTYYLDCFLNNYLIIERNCSINTLKSYKYSFKLFIRYLVENKNFKIVNISFETLTRDNIRDFFQYLETKGISANTINQRLAAIKSFCNYVKIEDPSNLHNIQQILAIKSKKYNSKLTDYLTKEELMNYINSINHQSKKGLRNLCMICLLYDSAARAQELIDLKILDLKLDDNPTVTLTGKGNKRRTVPLMINTKKILEEYISVFNFSRSSYIFKNNRNEKFTTKMLEHVVNKYSIQSKLNYKNITPHVFRKTRAMHLLEAGVNLVYIRDILGHSSIITTEIYARANEEIKRTAIMNAYNVNINNAPAPWKDNPTLLETLLDL